jgi:hypothetical protein
MPALDAIGDMLTTYVEGYLPNVWMDADRDFNNFFVVQELFKSRMTQGPDAPTFTWHFKVDSSDNTLATELFDNDSVNRINLLEKATQYYAVQKTHFAIDVREMSGGLGNYQVLNHLDAQASDMLDGFARKNEIWWWTLPVYPNTTNRKPSGAPYYVVKSTSTAQQAFGFNGSNPSGYSSVAGLDRTDATFEGTKNGAFVYGAINDSDGLSKLDDAINKSGFKPPYPSKGERVPAQRYKLASHYTPWKTYQDLLGGVNDNRGSDMGKYKATSDGSVFYRSIPWTWVDALTNSASEAYDSTEPIYGFDMSTWDFMKKGPWFMKKSEITTGNSHNLRVTWMDSIINYRCTSPRSNFVGHKATT